MQEVVIAAAAAAAQPRGPDRVGAEHLEHLGHVAHHEVLEVGVPLRQVERLELDGVAAQRGLRVAAGVRSEEHTSELQSPMYLVCRLLLEKKKQTHPLADATAIVC